MTLTTPSTTPTPAPQDRPVTFTAATGMNRVLITDAETGNVVRALHPSEATTAIREMQHALAALDNAARSRSHAAAAFYESMRDADEHDPEHDRTEIL